MRLRERPRPRFSSPLATPPPPKNVVKKSENPPPLPPRSSSISSCVTVRYWPPLPVV
jgi:hypothetical protein